MFKHYFELIEGIAIWPIISLTIFFVFFICVTLWAFSVRKDYIKEMEELPLDDSELKDINAQNV